MNVKDYFSRLEELHQKVLQDREMLEELQAYTSIRFYGSKVVGHGVAADHTGYNAMRIMEIEKIIAEDTKLLQDYQKNVVSLINTLENPKHIEILYKRYIEGKLWSQIMQETGYSKQTALRYHRIALEKMQQLIN